MKSKPGSAGACGRSITSPHQIFVLPLHQLGLLLYRLLITERGIPLRTTHLIIHSLTTAVVGQAVDTASSRLYRAPAIAVGAPFPSEVSSSGKRVACVIVLCCCSASLQRVAQVASRQASRRSH